MKSRDRVKSLGHVPYVIKLCNPYAPFGAYGFCEVENHLNHLRKYTMAVQTITGLTHIEKKTLSFFYTN